MKSPLLLFVCLALLLQACRKPEGPVDDRPAIRSVSFVGVPAQQVEFDAPNGRITVRLPPVLEGGLQPRFELSEGAAVTGGLLADNTVDLTPYCFCNQSSQNPEATIRISNSLKTSVYQLRVLPAGPLRAQAGQAPLLFSRKTKRLEMSLPVENLYSRPQITELAFTDVASGNIVRLWADGACISGCKSTAPNQLFFELSSPVEHYLVPGTYSITLIGRKYPQGVSFPQRLTVTD